MIALRSDDLRAAATNFLFKALSSPLERVCRLFVVVVAAPALGAAAFGSFQFANTATALLTLFTEFGLGVWTTRTLARSPERMGPIVAAGLRFRIAAVLPYLALLGATALAVAPGAGRSVILLLGVAAIANSIVDYFSAVLRGREDFRGEAAMNAARAVLTTVGALLGLSLARSLTAFAIGLMAGTVTSVGTALWLFRQRYIEVWRDTVRRRIAASAERVDFREVMPLWLAGLFSTLYFRCDIILLRFLVGDAEVGSYSAAYRIFEALTLLPGAIMAVAFPRLSREPTPSARFSRTEAWLGALLLALGVLIGTGLYAAAARIVAAVFGMDFAHATVSLRILARTIPVLFLNFGLANFLIARRRERPYLLIVIAMFGLNLSINALMIPRWGGPGAAWSTLVTEYVRSACCFFVLVTRASSTSRFG